MERAVKYYFGEEVQTAISEAKKVKAQYFNHFPDIKLFLVAAGKKASSRGWVKTFWGRKRHFEHPKRDGYKAPNAIIQGTCSDIMKIKLYELLVFLYHKQSKTILTVHDEVGLHIHKSEYAVILECQTKLQKLPFRINITTGIEVAHAWGDKTEISDISEIPGLNL